MDYDKLRNTVESSSLSITKLCSKVGIDRKTFYNNCEKKNMNIDVLERICDTLQIDIVDFFPQKITSKKRSNIQLDIDANDHVHIDIENRKLIIKKL